MAASKKLRYAHQWKRVARHRELIESGADLPFHQRLETAWWTLVEQRYVVQRDRDLELGWSPLEVAMWDISAGFYPPPEFLLALSESWGEYIESAGKKSLEECFLDRPRRKGGNGAKHVIAKDKARSLVGKMRYRIRKGATQVAASEAVADEVNMDVETVGREYRRHIKPLNVPRGIRKSPM